jgi:hypothetical protein
MEPTEVEERLRHYASFLHGLSLDVQVSDEAAGDGRLLAVRIVRGDGVLIGSDRGYLPAGSHDPIALRVFEAAAAQVDVRLARAMAMFAAIGGARAPRGAFRDELNVAIWSAAKVG